MTNLDEIKAQLDKVGDDGTWSGTAANTAHDKFRELYEKFPKFYEAIEETSKYLKDVVTSYQEVDASLTGNN